MMPAVGQTIDNAILAANNSLPASIIVKATIVISIALIAARLSSYSRASVRHAILAAGFAVLLALPITAIFAPPIHIALSVGQHSSTFVDNAPQSFGETSLAAQTSKNLSPSATKSGTPEFSLLDLLFAAWVIGVAIFLAPVIIGLWQVRSLRRTALPWAHGNSLAAALANESGLSRRIEVLLHESVAGPMTCGILCPAILFPVSAENWNESDLNRAIAHELEHIRRADWITHCLARIVCAAYWFHPLVWIAWRRLTLEAERACDDAVLARSEATAYAEQLVALARQLTAANKSPLLAMASRSDLTARIHAVLDTRQPRGRIDKPTTTLACAAVVFAIAVSLVQIVAAAPQSSADEWEKAAGDKLSFEVASVKPVNSGDQGRGSNGIQLQPGRLRAHATLRVLMQVAYGVQSFQVEGGPDWAGSEIYEIDAIAPGDAAKAQMYLMLQALLKDRFQLQVHRESRHMPIYALIPAGGGLKLPAPKDGSCSEHADAAGPRPDPGTRMQPPSRGGYLPAQCGGVTIALASDGADMQGSKVPTAQLASALSQVFGRTVIDQTGFSGIFDVNLHFLPDDATPGLPPPPPATIAAEIAAPSIFTALGQMGLRMKSMKGTVDVLVIDHAARPSAN